MPGAGEVTALLRAWRAGDRSAEDSLLPLVYGELRRRAVHCLARERPGHTLQPTALVHEAYLRLVDQEQAAWQDRAHFFAIAARLMRQILVDHARRRASAKRGRGREPVPLELAGDLAAEEAAADLVALDDALTALAEFDPEGARLIELRFFGGLSLVETAEALGVSRPTVVRRWRAVRAWLYGELTGAGRDA
jgi:RNA polymerase sigma factor (TIGR02999 family)